MWLIRPKLLSASKNSRGDYNTMNIKLTANSWEVYTFCVYCFLIIELNWERAVRCFKQIAPWSLLFFHENLFSGPINHWMLPLGTSRCAQGPTNCHGNLELVSSSYCLLVQHVAFIMLLLVSTMSQLTTCRTCGVLHVVNWDITEASNDMVNATLLFL